MFGLKLKLCGFQIKLYIEAYLGKYWTQEQ